MSNMVFGIFLGIAFFICFAVFVFILLCMRYSKREGVDIDEYVGQVTQVLGEAWGGADKGNPPEEKEYMASVKLLIHRNGKLSDIEITESSEWDEMDATIVKVVAAKSPVERIPKGYPYSTIEIEMSFHYS